MKKILISFLMIVGLISVGFAFDVPAKPNRLVNDYIGLMNSDQVQALETKLLDFEKKTSIQIAIVVLDDLDNEESSNVAVEIGEKWGVGQKSLDNGIVFLVVKYNQNAIEKLFNPKRGDVYIAPGYGLEPYLTDVEAGRLLDQYFIPLVKEEKYYEAIDATTSALLSQLGEIGWQQREELEAKRKAEAAESMRRFGNGLLMFLLFGAIGGLILYLIVKARIAYQKVQLISAQRKSLKKLFVLTAEEYKHFYSQVILLNTSDYPEWAIVSHNKIMKEINEDIVPNADKERETFLALFGNDLDPLRESFNRFKKLVSRLGTLTGYLESIPDEIRTYREGAPAKLKAAEEKIQEFAMSIQALRDKGFILSLYEKELGDFKASLSQIKEKMTSEKDESEFVFLESFGIYDRIVEVIMPLMNEDLNNRELTSKTINNLTTHLESLPAHQESAQKVLDQLKAGHPKQNWEDLEKAFASVPVLLSICKTKIEESELNNSMVLEEFTTAKKLADEANEKMKKILAIFQTIHNRKDEIVKAKTNYASLLQSAETEISSAKSKCLDSDVEYTTKQICLVLLKIFKAKQMVSVFGGLVSSIEAPYFITTTS
jgi:uncharacterized membrane protein YgcG